MSIYGLWFSYSHDGISDVPVSPSPHTPLAGASEGEANQTGRGSDHFLCAQNWLQANQHCSWAHFSPHMQCKHKLQRTKWFTIGLIVRLSRGKSHMHHLELLLIRSFKSTWSHCRLDKSFGVRLPNCVPLASRQDHEPKLNPTPPLLMHHPKI